MLLLSLYCLSVVRESVTQADFVPITVENAGQVEAIQRVGRGIVRDLAWSPDGETLAVATTVGVWTYGGDLNAEPHLLAGQTGASSVTWSPGGEQIASGGDDATVMIWDAQTYEPLVTLTNHVYRVHGLSFYDAAALLASRDISGVVRVWSLDTGSEILTVQNEVGEQTAPGYEPDPAVSAWVDSVLNSDAVLATTALNTGDQSAQVMDGVGWLLVNIAGVQTVLDEFGVEIAAVSFDSTGNPLPGAAADVPVAFSPVGDVQATADDRAIVLSGAAERTLPGHSATVRSLAFSPDGAFLASGGDDSRVHLWDVASGELLRSYFGHIRAVYGMSFNPDGSLLATGSLDGTVQLHNVATGESLLRLEGHNGGVTGVAFNPDGSLLASSSFDGTIMLWGIAGE